MALVLPLQNKIARQLVRNIELSIYATQYKDGTMDTRNPKLNFVRQKYNLTYPILSQTEHATFIGFFGSVGYNRWWKWQLPNEATIRKWIIIRDSVNISFVKISDVVSSNLFRITFEVEEFFTNLVD